MIENASETEELTPLVLLIIRNRLELARHDVKSYSYYVSVRYPIVFMNIVVKKNLEHFYGSCIGFVLQAISSHKDTWYFNSFSLYFHNSSEESVLLIENLMIYNFAYMLGGTSRMKEMQFKPLICCTVEWR